MSSTSGACRTKSPPDFRPMPWEGRLVPSFRTKSWSGIKSGRVGINSTNRTHVVCTIRGDLDVGALEHACESLLERHDVLGVSLREVGGMPCLDYGERKVSVPPLERIDLVRLPERERQLQARVIANERIWRPFNVAGPLFRMFLITLDRSEHIFGWVLHHFIADAISMLLVGHELLCTYSAHLRRSMSHSPREPFQYRDYLLVMSEWISSCQAQLHLSYWKSRLARVPEVSWPEDAASASAAASEEVFEIDAAQRDALRSVARALGTSIFTLLLTAQKAMLSRLSDQTDITVEAVVGGRESPILRHVIGYFADRVYYRTDLSGNPRFAEAVERVGITVAEAAIYQFARSDLLRPHLSEVGGIPAVPAFNFNPITPVWKRRVGDTIWTPLQLEPPASVTVPSGNTRYWMDLRDHTTRMVGRIRYGGRSGGLARRFVETIHNITANCDRRLDELP